MRIFTLSLMALLFLDVAPRQLAAQTDADSAEDDIVMPDSAAQALERVKQEAEKVKERERSEPQGPVNFGIPVRSARGTLNGDALKRNGIDYIEDWTIRAGVTRLRLPAREGWESVNPNAAFFQQLANSGVPGEFLASVLINRSYLVASRSKYVNFFMEIRVPQEFAFTLMTPDSFAAFKEEVQENTVKTRKRFLKRDDFLDFDDYMNFKFGHDEKVDEFVDGFMVRALDEPDMVIYFATSEFIYSGPKGDTIEPMITTVCYALVNDKLLRIDVKRVFAGEEDIPILLAATKAFVQDMRRLNGLSDDQRRR